MKRIRIIHKNIHNRSIFARQAAAAFSLVEVALALAVCSFSLLAIVSLLPVALGMAGKAVDLTRRAKVIQQVSNELQQGEYSTLTATTGGLKWTFDSDGLATSVPAQTVYTVTGRLPQNVTLPGSAANPELVTILLEVESHAETQLVPVVIANRGN